MYKVNGHTIAGKRTINAGMENQDFLETFDDEKIAMIVVSDGCTGCNAPREAAIINCEVAKSIIKIPTIWQMGAKKFKAFIADKYEDAFYEADERFEDLAATTAFVIVNKQTNQYIAFACGDTAILSFDPLLKTKSLIKPLNIGKKISTIFTNQISLLKKFGTFVTGQLDDNTKGFVVYSDGADTISNEPNDYFKRYLASLFISEELYNKEQEDLFAGLKEITNDDISIGILTTDDEDIRTNARNIYYNHDYANTEKRESVIVEDKIENTKSQETSSIVRSESKLLEYLRNPTGIAELANSGLIKEEEIIPTLITLIRNGIVVSCVDTDTFKAV